MRLQCVAAALLLLFAGCLDIEGDGVGECTDEADNDADGWFDCDDPDCFGSPDCGDHDDSAVPLELSESLGFDATYLGCSGERNAELRNVSDHDVVVETVEVASEAEDYAVRFYDGVPPWTLPPGGSRAVVVGFQPQRPGSRAGTLTVGSPDTEALECNLSGEGVAYSDHVDSFTGSSGSELDVLFVVDNSCSMEPQQEALASMSQLFLTYLIEEGADFHIGVVTTDSATLQGDEPIVTPESEDPYGAFENNVQVGTAGSGYEMPLWFGLQALTSEDPHSPNASFLRGQAELSVILFTNEDDQSEEEPQYYVDEFAALKPSASDAVVDAIYGGADGCSMADGLTVDPAPRIAEVVDALNGTHASVCESDEWWIVAENLVELLDGPLTVFQLTQTPMPATLAVTVGDEELTDCWFYEEEGNAVTFDAPCVPPGGSEVTVYYVVPAPEC